MSNTFSRIYIQFVFAVNGRRNMIHSSWEERLYRYITGIVQEKDQKMLAINGIPNHIHFLIGMKPTCVIPDLIREVKKSSTDFIKNEKLCRSGFNWQDGYGAFSYGHWDLDRVIKYILNQKEHHKKQTFKDEYIGLLNEFEIEFKPEYLFEWFDDYPLLKK